MLQTLVEQFIRLKTTVGGNRELTEFEWTFGMPKEEQLRITPPNRWQRRILGELEFALKLAEENPGQFEEAIGRALGLLLAAQEREGAIGRSDIETAEGLLAPLTAAAREYEVILAAHAHIDMNWMWSWQETVSLTLDTFRTMLQLMDEYPQFCYSQSQASVYRIVEEFDPPMMEAIRRRVAEGRWEITAAAWVETDKNMPSTESLARHILYTKKYLKEHWGIDPRTLEVDFSPDTFGHSAHLPELLRHTDVKYYYHCRGYDGEETLYRWRAPSGAEVLIYREPHWYNSGITPRIGAAAIELARRCQGFKTSLVVYGVGDHGGGPSRRDIERALDMMTWPVFPRLRFGGFRDYFHAAEAVRGKLPVVAHELNYFAQGCYTTQSRIKQGNRKSEAALGDAEAVSALAAAHVGQPYRAERFESAWRNVLFTHFHDILTGSCVQDSREHAMGLYSEVLAIANTARSQAMRAIAAQIDSSAFPEEGDIANSQSEGAGVGGVGADPFALPVTERGVGLSRLFHLFNPSAHRRQAVVTLTVWDWTGDMSRLAFEDADGKPLECQLIDRTYQHSWDHKYFRVQVLADLPAMGYTTCRLYQKPAEHYAFHGFLPGERTQTIYHNVVLENEHLRAEFDYRSGALLSLVDKADGRERIPAGQSAGLELVQTDGATADAWRIGRYISQEPLRSATSLQVTMDGPLCRAFTAEYPFLGSVATMEVRLEKGAKALAIDLTVDWHEVSRQGTTVPLLRYVLPPCCAAPEYLFDVPAGIARRVAAHTDVPALQYGAMVDGSRAVVLVSDCKYGFRATEDGLGVTLIHAPHGPDPDPERGVHHIKLAVGLADACPKALEELAFDCNHPAAYLSARPHGGSLPAAAALLELAEGTTAVLSGVKRAEDGSGLVARLYNPADTATEAVLRFPLSGGAKAALAVDVLEQPEEGTVTTEGDAVRVKLGPCAMAAVKVTL